MNFKFSVVALFVSVAAFCSESNADLLSRMLGRSGCGCEATASSCCDTPASSCGGSTCGIGSRLGSRLGGGLLSRAGGCGCDGGAAVLAVDTATDCGCTQAPVDTCGADTCGTDTCGTDTCGGGRRQIFNGQLLSRLGNRGGCDTGCDAAPSCGCEAAPAPAPSCGCDAPASTCGGGGRLFNGNLLARLRGNGGCDSGCDAAPSCGCEAAPAPSCGCDAAPVESCGCGGGSSMGILARVRGMGSRRCGSRPQMRDIMTRLLTPKASSSCGCDAPVEMSCGCDAAPTCGGGRVGLLSRLRSLRPNRGGSCGCDSGCDAAPATSCGCGSASSPVIYDSNIQAVPAAPANGPVVPESVPVVPQAVPVVPATPAAPGSVIAPGGSTSKINNPVVDPSSFVIRNN